MKGMSFTSFSYMQFSLKVYIWTLIHTATCSFPISTTLDSTVSIQPAHLDEHKGTWQITAVWNHCDLVHRDLLDLSYLHQQNSCCHSQSQLIFFIVLHHISLDHPTLWNQTFTNSEFRKFWEHLVKFTLTVTFLLYIFSIYKVKH